MIDVRLSVAVVALTGATVASALVGNTRAPADARGEVGVSAAAAGTTGPARDPGTPSDLPPRTLRSDAEPEPHGPVVAVRPSIRIADVDDPAVLTQVRATPGVAVATEIRIGTLPARDGSRSLGTVRIAAVDPVEFRVLTPQPTADALGVWERLDQSEAAFTHGQAQARDLSLGGYVELGDRATPVRIGALASNGTPPIADAIVDRATGSRLGLGGVAPTLLVAVGPDVDPASVADHLRDLVRATVEVIPDPRVPKPVPAEQQRGAATVWDSLALCESSGDWHLDAGNGFYGGLQFLPESWWVVGGTGMPHEASREEQIQRAEVLLRVQGWQAWPVCSVRLGLRPPPPGWTPPGR